MKRSDMFNVLIKAQEELKRQARMNGTSLH